MNCDQAFDRLTDPAATTDTALARHLEHCSRCRAMQQTLSPAMDWMKAAATDDFASQERNWDGTASQLLTEESVAVAMEISRRLPQQGITHSARKALGIAIVAMFGMAFGVLVLGQKTETPARAATTSPATKTAVAMCLWTRPEGTASLSSISSQSVVDSCIACHVPTMLRN